MVVWRGLGCKAGGCLATMHLQWEHREERRVQCHVATMRHNGCRERQMGKGRERERCLGRAGNGVVGVLSSYKLL